MELYLVDISCRLEKIKYNYLCRFVEKSTKERLSKFVFYDDALRTLLGELLVKKLFCEKLGYGFDRIKWSRGEYGKPFIMPGTHLFNISHSGDYVVCVIDNSEVGVDIEKIKKIDFEIAKRFFNEMEHNFLSSLDTLNKLPAFYRLWTMKESYIKALGKGLSKKLNSFSVIGGLECSQVLEKNEYSGWYVYNVDILKDYKISVCSNKRNLEYEINYSTIEEILYFYSLLKK